jgi:hypothetical protein
MYILIITAKAIKKLKGKLSPFEKLQLHCHCNLSMNVDDKSHLVVRL